MKRSAFSILVLLVAGSVAAQPESSLWPVWELNDPADKTSIDHESWTSFLAKYVVADSPDGIHRVRYGDVTAGDRMVLDRYIADLEAVTVSDLNRNEQMAFWINLYNALTVQVVLDHYPVDSIRAIRLTRGLFSNGPWQAKLLRIEGEEVSLDDIEHRILRPIWRDPRIHYAVNCASLGCPNLQPTAFTVETLDDMLDRSAREYIRHPRAVNVQGARLTLSSIYDWFSEDFDADGGVVEHLISFAGPDLAQQLRSHGGRVRYEYDWSLNDG